MRTMPAAASGRICKKMRQIEELCSVEQAYFIRARHHACTPDVLKGVAASRFWDQDIFGELKRCGVDAFTP